MTELRVRAVAADEMAARQAELAAFERSFVYPLGRDRFHIDHGADYLAFFRALGEPFPYIAEREGRIAGVLVAVQRVFGGRRVWYVCDLKVEPRIGSGGARQLLRTWASEHVGPHTPAFGVSMNAADGGNRLVRAARRCVEAQPLATQTTLLFSLDYGQWQRAANVLQPLGEIGFLDPHGTKDIVLESTGRPMPLLHLQHGPLARRPFVPARPGATHMLCLPATEPLVASLLAVAAPSASATIVHRGLDGFDWRQLLTSDI